MTLTPQQLLDGTEALSGLVLTSGCSEEQKEFLFSVIDKLEETIEKPRGKFYLAVARYAGETSGLAVIEKGALRIVQRWHTDDLDRLADLICLWLSQQDSSPLIVHGGGVAEAVADMVAQKFPMTGVVVNAKRGDISVCYTVETILDAEMESSKRIPINYGSEVVK